jgi:hypothetical protein
MTEDIDTRYEFDAENAREPLSLDDENSRGKLYHFIQAALGTDDDGYREYGKLANEFPHLPPETRAGIDHAFIRLCGWSFSTILHAALTGKGLHDASGRERSEQDLETDMAYSAALGYLHGLPPGA